MMMLIIMTIVLIMIKFFFRLLLFYNQYIFLYLFVYSFIHLFLYFAVDARAVGAGYVSNVNAAISTAPVTAASAVDVLVACCCTRY